MKIAFVNQPWTFACPPRDADSIGILTHELAKQLVADHQIAFYGREDGSGRGIKYGEDGIQYIGISSKIIERLSLPLKAWLRFGLFNSRCPYFASLLYYLGYIFPIARSLRSRQFDIIHIHNFSQFIPLVRAVQPKAKIAIHMNCEWLNQLDRTLIEARLRKCDLVIGCSDYITNKIRERFPQFANRCRTNFNGVDVDFFSKDRISDTPARKNGVHRLLYVGRVSPEKGIHVLIEAFEKVLTRFPRTELKIIGPDAIVNQNMVDPVGTDPLMIGLSQFYHGNYKLKCLERLSSKTRKSISFIAPVQHSKLLEYYQESDIFLFPSVWHEPFGIPLVEAMSMEIPVIATRGGAFPEIVEEGKTGLLVERADAVGLADAIISLLSNKKLRKTMGRAGRKRSLEKFSYKTISDRLVSSYRKICTTS